MTALPRFAAAIGKTTDFFEPSSVRHANLVYLSLVKLHKRLSLAGLRGLELGWNTFASETPLHRETVNVRLGDYGGISAPQGIRFVITGEDTSALSSTALPSCDLLVHIEVSDAPTTREEWCAPTLPGSHVRVVTKPSGVPAVLVAVMLDIGTATATPFAETVASRVHDVYAGSLARFYAEKVSFAIERKAMPKCHGDAGYFALSRHHPVGSGYEWEGFRLEIARLTHWIEFLRHGSDIRHFRLVPRNSIRDVEWECLRGCVSDRRVWRTGNHRWRKWYADVPADLLLSHKKLFQFIANGFVSVVPLV